jgi:3-methylcrotonyl-CoA carboxylase alpha subunit
MKRAASDLLGPDGETVPVEAEQSPDGTWRVVVSGREHSAKVRLAGQGDVWIELDGGPPVRVRLGRDGERRFASVGALTYESADARAAKARRHVALGDELMSPMPGKVIAVEVEAGQAVTRGQVLVRVEAMKMEHAIRAPRDGVVQSLRCEAGSQVDGGALLVELEPE